MLQAADGKQQLQTTVAQRMRPRQQNSRLANRPQRQRRPPHTLGSYVPSSQIDSGADTDSSDSDSEVQPDHMFAHAAAADQTAAVAQTQCHKRHSDHTTTAPDDYQPTNKKLNAQQAQQRSDVTPPKTTSAKPVLVMPDGSKAVDMVPQALNVSGCSVYVPAHFVQLFQGLPLTFKLSVTVDGDPADLPAGATAQVVRRADDDPSEAFHLHLADDTVSKYKDYVLTRLSTDSSNTRITLHLQSPAGQSQAGQQQAVSANPAAAQHADAAAAAADTPHWFEAKKYGNIVRPKTMVIPPLQLMRDAFGARSQATGITVNIAWFKDDQLIGRTTKYVKYFPGAHHWLIPIPLDVKRQVLGCKQKLVRCAAPDHMEVYFTSAVNNNITPPPPVSTPSEPAAAAELVPSAAAAAAASPRTPQGLPLQAGLATSQRYISGNKPPVTAPATVAATRAAATTHTTVGQVNHLPECDLETAVPCRPAGQDRARQPLNAAAEPAEWVIQNIGGAKNRPTAARHKQPTAQATQTVYAVPGPLTLGWANPVNTAKGLRLALSPAAAAAAAPQLPQELLLPPPVLVKLEAAGVGAAAAAASLPLGKAAAVHTPSRDCVKHVAQQTRKDSSAEEVQLGRQRHSKAPAQQQDVGCQDAPAAVQVIDLTLSDDEDDETAPHNQQHGLQDLGGVHSNSADPGAIAEAAPQTAAGVGAVASPPAWGLQPVPPVLLADAFGQLNALLTQLKVPDELMQRLQKAAVALVRAEESGTEADARKVELFQMHYGFIKSWVEKGRGEIALWALQTMLKELGSDELVA